MRISDDRYRRDLRRYQLARRLFAHGDDFAHELRRFDAAGEILHPLHISARAHIEFGAVPRALLRQAWHSSLRR